MKPIHTQLKVGARVTWKGDSNDLGIVTEKFHSGVTICWDNGEEGSIANRDLRGNVQLAYPNWEDANA